MAERVLRAVELGETPDPPKMPDSMVDAVTGSRLDLLRRSRLVLSTAIDAGPPAHAVSKMLAELRSLDAEIRGLEGGGGEPVGPAGSEGARVGDEPFDEAAI